MEKWKVKTDKHGKVHVQKDALGNFLSRDEAELLAKKLAQKNKTILLIHEENQKTQTDYTSFLTPEEIYGKQESEVKIARAELAVAKVALKKWKKDYKKAHTEEEKIIKRGLYREARERVHKEKINLKNAKKKFKEAQEQL